MAINPYIPIEVNPGEPVTAQGWNVIVDAIRSLTTYLTNAEASSLKVAITNALMKFGGVRVTALRDDGISFEAVAPVPPGTNYIFNGLPAGTYTIRVEAPGFEVATQSATVPKADPMSFTLAQKGAFVPALFGTTVQTALQTLKDLNIHVSQILDVTGRDVAPANPGSAYNSSPVLAQIPPAGHPLDPGGSVQLVVATVLQVQPSVEVPPLTGLTLAEAQKVLDGLGLVLGKVTTLQKPLVPQSGITRVGVAGENQGR